MAIQVSGNDIADLTKASGGRNAYVFAEVVEAFQYPQTHACIESLQLAVRFNASRQPAVTERASSSI
jgi:hypothetical protein